WQHGILRLTIARYHLHTHRHLPERKGLRAQNTHVNSRLPKAKYRSDQALPSDACWPSDIPEAVTLSNYNRALGADVEDRSQGRTARSIPNHCSSTTINPRRIKACVSYPPKLWITM